MEWFGWEGHLKTVQTTLLCGQGCCSSVGACCARAQPGPWGIWHAGEEVSCNALLCPLPSF